MKSWQSSKNLISTPFWLDDGEKKKAVQHVKISSNSEREKKEQTIFQPIQTVFHTPQENPKTVNDNIQITEHKINLAELESTLWFNFTIELGPGMTANLQIFEDSEPAEVVEKFFTRHHINATSEAKDGMKQTISMLIGARKESLSKEKKKVF
ncbi:hypothetical protein RO3G_02465 [Rhizopus delemar RA 99-880]|uniref:Uncharacterized protein n=1 Tax=Rhizopus delemar (strain RA 99-880 / ATCC MYA-4621 / FGSC 9543 / NRRL 43880) TaxID=246409 RepID=I1BNI1_RHIO9|nr:hypothetical protein RO3G_02465 [Rhizopus delemar RA 99-880]|eukprot:EIE77761.1 hypothetical protein RO3G_02465 [Rhizopus delemar RA 99-880]